MKKKKRLTRDDLELMIMATPTLVWFLLFSFLPMLGVLIAFKNFHISGGGFINSFLNSPWVGFKNFEFLFSTNEAFTITRNTLLYNLCFIVLDVAVPVTFALMLHEIRNRRAAKAYQTILFLPYFLSWVVVGSFLYAFLSPDKGIINHMITQSGGTPVSWYTNTKPWPFLLIFIRTWKEMGYGTVIYLASLAGIDTTFYEAAVIDGATKWQQFKKITFPLLMASINNVVVLSIIGGLKVFDIVVATTGGGPGYATEVFNTMIYNSYSYQKYGEATAGTTLLAGMILIITLCTYRTIAKNEVEL